MNTIVNENTTTTTTTTNETEETFNVERRFFTPEEIVSNIEALQALIAKVTSDETLQYVGVNFETDTIPDGFGLLVLPVSTRLPEGKGNKMIGVGVIPMPTFEHISSTDAGAEFIRNSVIDSLAAKVANGIRPKGEETTLGTNYPRTFEDFITNRRGGAPGEMKAFNTFAPDIVKTLRGKGLVLDKAKLRMIFASKAAAEAEFPKIKQEVWTRLISAIIVKAEAERMDTSILNHWLEARDETEIDIRDELDISDLEGII